MAPSHHRLHLDLWHKGVEKGRSTSVTGGGIQRQARRAGCVCGERERDLGWGRECGYGKRSVVRAGVRVSV